MMAYLNKHACSLLLINLCLMACKSDAQTEAEILKQQCPVAVESNPLCKIAFDQNLTPAEKIAGIGFLYFTGQANIPKDDVQAFKLFSFAAQQGDAEAINALGMMYMNGAGCDQDLMQAEKYFVQASRLNERNAKNNLAALYRKQHRNAEAEKWYLRGIADDPSKAYEGLSKLYVEQGNYKQAYEYSIKASEYRNAEAEYNLGVFYEQGIYVEKNNAQALYWYRRAASQGHQDAAHNMRIVSEK